MALTLSLPRAWTVTDELVASVPGLEPDELQRLRQRVVSELTPLAAELPEGVRLVLDGYRYRLAVRQPEQCAERAGPFTPSPAACRRAIGVVAVDRCLRRRAVGPADAVAQVLAAGAEDARRSEEGDGSRAPWWARWYAELGPGGRAAVAAEATTWATQLWTALAWDRIPPPVVIGGRHDWWDLPGQRLTLRSRAEVRAQVDRRAVLAVVLSGAPDGTSRSELSFVALVSALAGGARSAPGRVLGLWPAAGQVRVVPVGARALEVAADELLSATATWVDALIEQRGRGT
ncbi:MAG TPA: hypothetical protein DCQ30_05700 [Acidimicrobiaceae bacterium]|nr:hypothetical protein [Acidimicrobiaceae bacterium]